MSAHAKRVERCRAAVKMHESNVAFYLFRNVRPPCPHPTSRQMQILGSCSLGATQAAAASGLGLALQTVGRVERAILSCIERRWEHAIAVTTGETQPTTRTDDSTTPQTTVPRRDVWLRKKT